MNNKGYFLPVSILIAAVLVSGAVIFTAGKNSGNDTAGPTTPDPDQAGDPAELIDPVSDNDYIRGNPDAPIKIVEYSDYECPFCKSFHDTMDQVLDEYEDQVAWVYRQFPIESLHSKAPTESEAAECVGKLGGNEAFWTFTDRIFEVTPSNNGLNLDTLPDIAEVAGVDRTAFESCLESGDMEDNVSQDVKEARSIDQWVRSQGGRGIGTPFSVVIGEDGSSLFFIPGALSFDQIKPSLDEALNLD